MEPNKAHKVGKKISIWQWGFLLFLVVGTVWILRENTQHQGEFQLSQGRIFGTYYTIKYEKENSVDSLIMAELMKVDHSLSMFNPHSIIARINNNETDSIDALLLEMLNLSEQISNQTSGAFDVTVAPLVNAWGFGLKKQDTVSSVIVDSILTFVGYDKLTFNNNILKKSDPRMKMDFSAVAKGYGVDLVARMLNAQGVQNYMVEIGGEVVVKGRNQKGNPWTIEIASPIDSGSEASDSKILLSVSNIAMATSGNYRRFYIKDGKRYAHTIDSHTGYPVQHTLLSATVLASDCAAADAYATSFMVMGLEKAQMFLSGHPELSAYLIYSDEHGKLKSWNSSNMDKFIIK